MISLHKSILMNFVTFTIILYIGKLKFGDVTGLIQSLMAKLGLKSHSAIVQFSALSSISCWQKCQIHEKLNYIFFSLVLGAGGILIDWLK